MKVSFVDGVGVMAFVSGKVTGLTGWPRRTLALLAGSVAVLAMAPLFITPAMLISLVCLAWLVDGSRRVGEAFGAGWWWGVGWFLCGSYWVFNPFLKDSGGLLWMTPLIAVAVSAVPALFLGVATAAAFGLTRPGIGRVFVLASLFTLAIIAQSSIATAFDPPGAIWAEWPALIQHAAFIGIHGLTATTLVMFLLPAQIPGRRLEAKMAIAGLAAAIFLLQYAIGTTRLQAATEWVPGVTLRLAQRGVHEIDADRGNPKLIDEYEQLARHPGYDRVSAVLLGEWAIPYPLKPDDALIPRLGTSMAAPGGLLIAGAAGEGPLVDGVYSTRNTLLVIDAAGRLLASYDKHFLAPVGESPFLDLPTLGGTPMVAGPGLRTVSVEGLPPFGPLICYDASFSGRVIGRDQPRPDWLLVASFDGWEGFSNGPYMHLTTARLRAVEEGLPVVRIADSGVSAVFDGLGRQHGMLGVGQRGILDVRLPKALADMPPFARHGISISLATCLLLLAIGLWIDRRLRI